ncbi:MAG: hypothetical protein GEU71_13175 [Actinobacteria bacterium]|nr:hypothetical protein [Actinomycetota bacterium]
MRAPPRRDGRHVLRAHLPRLPRRDHVRPEAFDRRGSVADRANPRGLHHIGDPVVVAEGIDRTREQTGGVNQPSELVLPSAPEPGSTIAIVSPSAPLVAAFPHRVERGTAYLEGLGYEVRIMPNAGLSTGWTAGSGQERAADINAAFDDPDVSVVMAAIGGTHSAQLLPYLDFELIAANPKVFQGFSDNTMLHWAFLARARLQTFHGPMFLSELAEYPEVLPYTGEWMMRAWSCEWKTFEPATEWTDEFLDWAEKRDLERPRRKEAATGWRCIRPGVAEGPLLGGCLESLAWHLRKSEI